MTGDEIRKKIIETQGLPDSVLAGLYHEWSEAAYCAGWLMNGEEEFVEYLVGEKNTPEREVLRDYERETIEKIRNLLTGRLAALMRSD